MDIKLKIKNISFQMFRDWTKNAIKKYPDYDFTIIDESILLNDLIQTIKSAVKSLKEEEVLNRKKQDYDVGFIRGFIHGNLNLHWYHEYIRKRSQDYKDLMILKAIQLYFDMEEISTIKIENLYKKIYQSEMNLENIFVKVDKKKFAHFGIDYLPPELDESRHENLIACFIENQIKEKIASILKNVDESFLLKIENYFNDDDIKQIIDEY
ncbi:MAG: hypothetical protein V1781_09180 [Bacteroidota bacterium]